MKTFIVEGANILDNQNLNRKPYGSKDSNNYLIQFA